ncbi:MAG: sigma-70 family RNA polymerase sigma factor [Ruminococcaceae bacterium]|nr:sigma-70 family RNA polymerase sigma factor [Oscillospiraceae bacterium]
MKNMEEKDTKDILSDDKIIELYWDRDERAISETDRKYGRYLYAIAYNIVHDHPDCEECLNDTYLGTWNKIPPERPTAFQSFLSKIMRNIAIDRFRKNTAQKRIPSEMTVSLGELDDCIAYDSDLEEDRLVRELAVMLNDFLSGLPKRRQFVFVCRYYYSDSVTKIAEMLGLSEKTIRRDITAMKSDLKAFLEKGGYSYE